MRKPVMIKSIHYSRVRQHSFWKSLVQSLHFRKSISRTCRHWFKDF